MNAEEKEVYKVFCDSVKKICVKAGIGYKELAYRTHVKYAVFCNKINGLNGNFNLVQALRIAKELDESLEDLATGKI